MVLLVYALALIFILLGFLLGISLGWGAVHSKKSVGKLLIAPGEDGEAPYMFLDLVISGEYLEQTEYVLLKVEHVKTREKQAV